MSGLIPAFPLMIIRPFLRIACLAGKKDAGTLKRPSFLELFAPEFRRTTIVTTIMFACSYGAAFWRDPAVAANHTRLGGCEAVQERTGGKPDAQQRKIQKDVENKAASNYTKVQEVGGLLGRAAAGAAGRANREPAVAPEDLPDPGLLLMPMVFALAATQNPVLFTIDWGVDWNWYAIHFGVWEITLLHVGILFAGVVTVGQFSFWGNYLPLVYPVHLRGTGESFAANIGGRMFGTSFAWLTGYLAVLPIIPGDSPPAKVAFTAAGVALFVYAAGSLACFWLPEPKRETLADARAGMDLVLGS